MTGDICSRFKVTSFYLRVGLYYSSHKYQDSFQKYVQGSANQEFRKKKLKSFFSLNNIGHVSMTTRI